MSCPFAFLLNRSGPSSQTSFQAASSSSFHGGSSLTGQMKAATWDTHRQLERSDGIAALMGRSKDNVRLARIDYIRFLIMLACMYAVMESVVLDDVDSPVREIVSELARTETLMRDIQAHLNELAAIQQPNNATLSDICMDDELDQHRSSHSHQRLHKLVTAAMSSSYHHLTFSLDHVLLLSIEQTDAVLHYLDALQSHPPLHRPPPYNVTVIAHVYVRYMGDLSGGQHMSKRLTKLFPLEGPHSGFSFYAFDDGANLKHRLRATIDNIDVLDDNTSAAIVRETVTAFDLHHAIFASLLPSNGRLTDAADAQTLPTAPSTVAASIPQLPAASLRATAVASA